MNLEEISERMRQMNIADFKPYALYESRDIRVKVKDCSLWEECINPWLTIFWENHRPWYWPFKKCVGFALYCPQSLKLSGEMYVTKVLDLVALTMEPKKPFEKYEALLYRLAKGLRVQFPTECSHCGKTE